MILVILYLNDNSMLCIVLIVEGERVVSLFESSRKLTNKTRNFMKKRAVAAFVFTGMFCSSAFADDAANDASIATLNFDGRVTSSSCQVATNNTTQSISLGEVTLTQLENGSTPSHTFSVDLINCDTDTSEITYTLNDLNAQDSGQDYLALKAGDDSASGVGVYVMKNEDGSAVTTGTVYTVESLTSDSSGTSSSQTIPFKAQIKATNGDIKAGTVEANATLTIKAVTSSADI